VGIGLVVPPPQPIELTPHPSPVPEAPALTVEAARTEPVDRGPVEVEGPVEAEGPAVGDLSEGGTDSGVLVIGLASVTLATAGALVAFGAIQIQRGRDKQEVCSIDPELNECQIDRPVVRFASAGLSLGLLVPVAVAGALRLRKGVRIRRDYKAFHQGQKVETRLMGGLGARGGHLGLRVRF